MKLEKAALIMMLLGQSLSGLILTSAGMFAGQFMANFLRLFVSFDMSVEAVEQAREEEE